MEDGGRVWVRVWMCLDMLGLDLFGLTYIPAFVSLCKLSRTITCPQCNIIGGLPSVACSFETGQVNIAW